MAAQSRELPEPYSRAGDDDQRHALRAVALGGVVDRHLLARRQVARVAALALDQRVAQPDVRERAAHHHLVVAAAGAVGVEVARLDAVLDQLLPGRRPRRDRAGGRDVVGGHRVAEHRQHARVHDVRRGRRRASKKAASRT